MLNFGRGARITFIQCCAPLKQREGITETLHILENKITLELTTDEAVVLFELLSRINQKLNTDLFEDQAEQRILWNLESDLESSLTDPFRADYEKVVMNARKAVRDSKEK